MPAITALISKSKLRPTYSPQALSRQDMLIRGRASFVCMPVCRKGAALASAFGRGVSARRDLPDWQRQLAQVCGRLRWGLLPRACGERHPLVGALQGFD